MDHISKSWTKSKTLQGLVVAIFGIILGQFDISETAAVEELVPLIFQVLGIIFAAYGRVKATKVIK